MTVIGKSFASIPVRVLPGVALCSAVAGGGYALQETERLASGRAWIEALVLAILIGAAIRTAWTPGQRWKPGIDFSAKLLLEIAIVLLGASLSAATILTAGWPLLVSIVGIVGGAILLSFCIGRMLGLSKRLAILVACGNSICGNSAIAAVAPVIGADGDDIASSIAFTAVLGVAVVLMLPLIGAILGMLGPADLLIAKEQDLMIEQRLANLGEQLVVGDRLAERDAAQFGANVRRELLDPHQMTKIEEPVVLPASMSRCAWTASSSS